MQQPTPPNVTKVTVETVKPPAPGCPPPPNQFVAPQWPSPYPPGSSMSFPTFPPPSGYPPYYPYHHQLQQYPGGQYPPMVPFAAQYPPPHADYGAIATIEKVEQIRLERERDERENQNQMELNRYKKSSCVQQALAGAMVANAELDVEKIKLQGLVTAQKASGVAHAAHMKEQKVGEYQNELKKYRDLKATEEESLAKKKTGDQQRCNEISKLEKELSDMEEEKKAVDLRVSVAIRRKMDKEGELSRYMEKGSGFLLLDKTKNKNIRNNLRQEISVLGEEIVKGESKCTEFTKKIRELSIELKMKQENDFHQSEKRQSEQLLDRYNKEIEALERKIAAQMSHDNDLLNTRFDMSRLTMPTTMYTV